MGSSTIRSRWAAFGAAVAVSLGAGGGFFYAHADSAQSSFISITPCRLFDLRAETLVGNRATPLTTGETFVRQVTGANGGCTIPANATGISYNLTVPDPTVTGFIKLFPADASAPNASAINPVAGGGTKANSGIVGLSATGSIALFNQVGPILALLDITGYFVPSSSGPAGPAGQRGVSAWDTIPSGQTVTGNFGVTAFYGLAASANYSVSLPAKAPVALTSANVNFATDANAATIDDDATCTGTAAAPTAPAGKVCIYPYQTGFSGMTAVNGFQANNLGNQAFYLSFGVAANTNAALFVTWAYTAP